MRFEEALKELREGCEVKRAEWDTKLLKVYESLLIAIPSQESYRIDLLDRLRVEDILAEDWEVVDEGL
jgi:hypothetical protein